MKKLVVVLFSISIFVMLMMITYAFKPLMLKLELSKNVRLIANTTFSDDKKLFLEKGCKIVYELEEETVVECPKDVASEFKNVVEDKTLNVLGKIENPPDYEVKDIYTDIFLGADYAWFKGYTGEGRLVAVLDTGIDYTHPDLGGCFGQGCKVIGGYDFVNDDDDPMDDHGHGTHVSGIIAANSTSNVYVTGVAPGSKIMMGKVCDQSGDCYVSDVIAGIEWAVNGIMVNETGDCSEKCGSNRYCCIRTPGCILEEKYECSGTYTETKTIKPDAISISLGGGSWITRNCDEDSLAKKINWAVKKRILVAISAGNSLYGVSSPGCASRAIVVGALGTYEYNTSDSRYYDRVASFSGRGYAMKHHGVLAPGVLIYSTFPGNSHGYMSGTSVAAPHVTGLIALMRQKNSRLGPGYIQRMIFRTAEDVNYGFLAEVKEYEQGHGRINIASAVDSIR